MRNMERQRRPWWQFFLMYAAFYGAAWVVERLLRLALGDELVTSVIQVLAVPALVLVVVFFAYVTWKNVEQPPGRG